MINKINKNLNARLTSEVRNFNKRRKRLEEKGVNNLPDVQSVKVIKQRYSSINQLQQEIARLKNFRGDVNEKININTDVKAKKWEYELLKANQKSALEYFLGEYDRINARIGKFPGERTYLDTIGAKIDLLGKDINALTGSQFRSAVTSVKEFQNFPTLRKERYREFLSTVDWLMDKLDYDEKERNAFFKKFEKLTPSQFFYAYDNNKIIARIYSLYHKDYGEEEGRLTTDEEDARGRVDDLIKQADEIIADAQLHVDY